MDLETPLLAALTPEARAAWAEIETSLRREPARLPVLLPQLPRRLGRQPLTADRVERDGRSVDLSAWRACDAAATLAFQIVGSGERQLDELFSHGDMEERAMVLRALAILPNGAKCRGLLDEVQRTNTVTHVESGLLDSNLLPRALAAGTLGEDDANRAMLKIAFLDLPLARVIDGERLANPELSRMLQDLATEREAAGRAVWTDTCRLIARAPTTGTLGRLAGALEHGHDGHRLAAAQGLADFRHPLLLEIAAERLPREPHPTVRAALESNLDSHRGS